MSDNKIEIIVNAKDNASKTLTSIGKIGSGILKAGLAAAGAGLAAVTAGLATSVKAAADAEGIQAQLAAVLKSTGGAAGVTADMVNDMATELSKVTRFEDDAIVAGQNMLLTFTGIGKDVFPATTQAMVDMSQAMGSDLQSTAILLGKALNNPKEGLTALTRVGVKFTEEQKAMIESMVAAGDVAGAQGVILQELQKEFGGSAEAAGMTFAGQVDILKNTLGNLQEEIGAAALPALTGMAQKLTEFANKPEVKAFIDSLIKGIGDFAAKVIEWMPKAFGVISDVFNFLAENKEIVIGALAAIAAAVAVSMYSSAAAAIAAAGGFAALWASIWPVVLIMAAVGVAAALLYKAWNSNFLGIRDIITNVWENKVKPAFAAIKEWLRVFIPKAIEWAGNAFKWLKSTILDPVAGAFQAISNAISGVIEWIKKMIDKLKNIKLPDWLTPGSPTPFELGLIGIGDALHDLSMSKLPEFTAGLNINPAGMVGVDGGGGSGVTNNYYNLSINEAGSRGNVTQDFAILKALAA